MGGRVVCSFAARFADRTTSLALIEGGYFRSPSMAGDDSADLEACIGEARREREEEETFASWDVYFAFERDSLKRWTPALVEAHRATMREDDGTIVPIVPAEILRAIEHGGRREPVTETYPLIAAGGVPVLLLTAPRPGLEAGSTPITRFRSALPTARVEPITGGIHDLVSHAPGRVAELVGEFVTAHL